MFRKLIKLFKGVWQCPRCLEWNYSDTCHGCGLDRC